MNKLFSKLMIVTAFLLFAADVMAQVPQGFNFQAVARDANGELIANTELGVRVSVLQGSETGTAVYTEVQTPTTSSVGSFQLVIGEGTSEDDFATVDWSADNYFVKLEIDPAGGTEYEVLGTTRLLSVPYALLAQDVVNGTTGSGDPITEYNLNTSEGDTSFIINTTGSESLAGLRINAKTDGQNIGVRSLVNSKNTSSAIQVGTWSSSSGEATGSHYGVVGQSNSQGRYNYGIYGTANGEGDGTIIPLGEGPDPEDYFGSYNIAGGFYSSGNLNGNVGVEAQAGGSIGERIDFGVISRAISTANSPNIGVRAEAFNSPIQNVGFEGDVTGSGSKNLGLRLHVFNGTSNIGMEVNADTAAILNGTTVVNGDLNYSGSLNNTSDRNLKENIQPLQNGLGTIMKLNPATYNFRGNGEYNGLKLSTGLHYGLIAQEVEEVLPSLVKNNIHTYSEVSTEGNGPDVTSETEITKTMEYKTMNYTELIPLLIKGMQEQQEVIEQLKKEIEELKKNK